MSKIVGSRARVLHILTLFETQPVWTVETLSSRLGVSNSSIYRDIQDLSRTGLLSAVAGAGYILGPAFIYYDRLVRKSDPLVQLAAPIMRNVLARTTQSATAVLCRRFRDCVMCVHQEEGSAPHAPTSYERGVAMPLFKGATSKAILAFCDERSLRATYRQNETAIRREIGCSDWKGFRDDMREIRDRGFAMTISEVAPGQVGLAAPILEVRQSIAGLSLVLHEADFPTGGRQVFAEILLEAAKHISKELRNIESWRIRA